jgi:hypothetical protein
MPRKSVGPKTRLNLEMTPAVRARLEDLRGRTQADSLAEVVRRALAVYDLVLETRASGGDLIIRSGDGREQSVVIL